MPINEGVKMQLKRNWIQTIAVFYLVIWTISPPLGIDMEYRLLALGSVGIWAAFAIFRKYYIEWFHVYAALFMLMVILVAYVERGKLDGVLSQIAIYILVLCLFIHSFYKDGRWHELSGLVIVVLILLSIYNHNTAQILAEDTSIARRLVRADEETFQYMRQGIGGYGLIYPQVCISPAILMWIKSSFRKNNICFIIGCIWLVTYFQCVSSSGYSIAIFVSVLGAIMLLFYKGRNAIGAIAVSAAVFIGFMLALLYSDGFREFLLQFFDGTEVASKINDIMSTSETGVTEDSIYYRMLAYETSFNVMLEYPVIGSLWNRSGGGHSAILDIFAKFGVLGGIIYCKMIFYVPNWYKKLYNDPKIWKISNAVIISILYVAMLDSFPFNFMGMLILVLPLLYEDIMKWEKIG